MSPNKLAAANSRRRVCLARSEGVCCWSASLRLRFPVAVAERERWPAEGAALVKEGALTIGTEARRVLA